MLQLNRFAFKSIALLVAAAYATSAFAQICPNDPRCINNPYGAGSPYKADGLMNPYSEYGSRYSNKSWTNPNATDAPKIYDQNGNYRGRLSSNPNDPDSISNPNGRYGNKHSPESINNPYATQNQTFSVNKSDAIPEYAPIQSGASPNINGTQLLVGVAILLGAIVLKAVVTSIIEAVNSSPSPVKQAATQTNKAKPTDPEAYIRENKLSATEAYRIGTWYRYSKTEANPVVAFKYLTYAANLKNPDAAFVLAGMYKDGIGATQNATQAFNYFKIAADEGFIPAQLITADSYYKGQGTEQNYAMAHKYYLMAAREGDALGMASVASMYRSGLGTKADTNEGRRWASKSNDKGNPYGAFQLAQFEQDDYEANFKLIKRAAAGNVPIAQYYLAYAYENGTGTEIDSALAREYYEKAANRSYPDAVLAMARVYEYGTLNSDKDPKKAMQMYLLASDLGVAGAKTKAQLIQRTVK